MKKLILLAALVACVSATAKAPAPLTDAQFAKTFQCPEALPGQPERRAETQRFMDWAMARHPEWTAEQMLAHRVKLLEVNDCRATLDSIRSNTSAK